MPELIELLAAHQYRLPFDSDGQVICTCTCDRTLRFTDDEEGHTLGELGHRSHLAEVIEAHYADRIVHAV